MIKMITPLQEVEKKIETYIQKSEQDVIKKLSFIGESALVEARTNGDYMDQTGNLRTSIGYVILKDGKVVFESSFDAVRPTATSGKEEGEKLIQELISEYRRGYVLLVVAGMDYAVYVEALGRNVLSSSKLLAESMAKSIL